MSIYHPIIAELRDELLSDVHDLDTAVKNALKFNIPEMATYGIDSGEGFLKFADWLIRGWVPTESTSGRDIYYIICIFYFVLAQEPLGGRQTSISPKNANKPLSPLSGWLVRFARTIGESMSKPESWNETSLKSFSNCPKCRVFEAEDPSNWKNFNQFFHRRLKKPRDIDSPDDDRTVVFPVDATFAGNYSITDESEVIIKHLPWKVTDLLGKYGQHKVPGSNNKTTYGELFKGGVWSHSFLNTYNYHRQHAPVSGKVEVMDIIEGATYIEISVNTDEKADGHNRLSTHRPKDGKPAGVDTLQVSCDSGYQFLQTRGLIIINNEKLGRVAVMPIGMAFVSSVNLHTELLGKTIKKGDEISYFAYGGSDCVVMFEEKAKVSNFPKMDAEHFYGKAFCKSNYIEADTAKTAGLE
ncbi:hypothetical protein DSL72_007985 [Monilinia vaccinii-corymbosi]|uniref:Phosphatidylserine decarboxylase n=1 Tax=Monilinia vaccinii-corymbosi TaxID=61207 RepID=A0A8A3PJ65_9HELO|nr:hypothetical protein DSL72_007985 [Monilinia vaccinii-corymbosi]